MTIISSVELKERVLHTLTKLTNLSKLGVVLVKPADTVTSLQTLFRLHDKNIDENISAVILTHALASERSGPGSFSQCIEKTHESVFKFNHNTHGYDYESPSQAVVESRAATRADIEGLLDKYVKDASLKMMFRDIMTYAGRRCKIVIERSQSKQHVEFTSGCTFHVTNVFAKNIKLERPRVVFIDGFIESVGEINKLLQEASEYKVPVILVARGFADDVISTLAHNFTRQTLNIIPVIVKYDLDGANQLVDMAISCNSDIISTLKGELISTISLQSLAIADNITLRNDELNIDCASASKLISLQRDKLREKLDKINDVEKPVIEKRLRSLVGNAAVIRLSGHDCVIKTQQADLFIRSLQSAIQHGVVDTQNGSTPASSELASSMHAAACVSLLHDIGAIVT